MAITDLKVIFYYRELYDYDFIYIRIHSIESSIFYWNFNVIFLLVNYGEGGLIWPAQMKL